MTEDEKKDWERAVMSVRFFDSDALELAMLATRTEGVASSRARVADYRRARDRLLLMAAGCELAACVFQRAVDEA